MASDPLHVASNNSTVSALQRFTFGRRSSTSTIMSNYIRSFSSFLLPFGVENKQYFKLPSGVTTYTFLPSLVPTIKTYNSPHHQCDSSKSRLIQMTLRMLFYRDAQRRHTPGIQRHVYSTMSRKFLAHPPPLIILSGAAAQRRPGPPYWCGF
jgi:hypothetical protein